MGFEVPIFSAKIAFKRSNIFKHARGCLIWEMRPIGQIDTRSLGINKRLRFAEAHRNFSEKHSQAKTNLSKNIVLCRAQFREEHGQHSSGRRTQ